MQDFLDVFAYCTAHYGCDAAIYHEITELEVKGIFFLVWICLSATPLKFLLLTAKNFIYFLSQSLIFLVKFLNQFLYSRYLLLADS